MLAKGNGIETDGCLRCIHGERAKGSVKSNG